MRTTTGVLAAVSLAAAVSYGTTIRVPADQTTIQAGVNATQPGDTVIVADGIFSGEGNTGVNFGGRSIVVRSEHGSEHTVIECPKQGAGASAAFVFNSGEDSSAILQGFTITGGSIPGHFNGGGIQITGSSPTISSVVFLNGGTFGGTFCSAAAPIFMDCVFRSNSTGCSGCKPVPAESSSIDGGALRCVEGSSPVLIRCRFENNYADAQRGGALACYDSSPELTDCVFSGNRAEYFESGGAVLLNHSSATFDHCLFVNNHSPVDGGAVFIESESSPSFLDCEFTDNSSGFRGGAVRCLYSSCLFSGCTFADNAASVNDCCSHGGALEASNSVPVISRCTFVGNGVDTTSNHEGPSGSAIHLASSAAVIENCLIAFNGPGKAVSADESAGVPVVICSDIFGNVDGDWNGLPSDLAEANGNFSKDPLLCDRLARDFNLRDDSPCLPAGNECADQIGAWGLGCVITSSDDEVEEPAVPRRASLSQNYPNPFNPSTTIEFFLPVRSSVNLRILNLLGRTVRTLVNDTKPSGYSTVVWDGRDAKGEPVASGIYFYTLEAGKIFETRKMVLLK